MLGASPPSINNGLPRCKAVSRINHFHKNCEQGRQVWVLTASTPHHRADVPTYAYRQGGDLCRCVRTHLVPPLMVDSDIYRQFIRRQLATTINDAIKLTLNDCAKAGHRLVKDFNYWPLPCRLMDRSATCDW
ncbi:hypothetical protein J6590_003153 [Homalodisca vitripennis]|nr:hypothetical protein J6590_003153 [Homalodisca vitripennis]